MPARPAKVQEINAGSIDDAGFRLEEGQPIGEGRFSQVKRGTHVASGIAYAVKVIEQEFLDQDEDASAALRTEVEVLMADGSHKSARHLRPGDLVWTFVLWHSCKSR